VAGDRGFTEHLCPVDEQVVVIEHVLGLLGRDVSPAETYLAHFLGVGQAARIIDAAHSKPHVTGARLLPAAARSNPAVFAPAGHAASAAAIVGRIEAYFSREVSPLARI